jgi:putative membrane protein
MNDWYGDHMGGWGNHMGGGWIAFMVVGTLLVIALLGALVVSLARRPGAATVGNTSAGSSATPRSTAYDVLDQRYACGEIDDEEYRARIATLDSSRGSGS